MILEVVSATLICGLNATPDGEAPPAGELVRISTPIPGNLYESLKSGTPPPPPFKIVGSEPLMPEWIIGLKEADGKVQIARLAHDIFDYKIRFGWAAKQGNGDYLFQETASGTCTIKSDSKAVGEEPK